MSDPILPLAVWESGTNENSIPANDNALRVEAMSRKIISKIISAQPGSPSDGDAYIIPAGPSGAQWATFSQYDLAIYRDGTWYAWAPVNGLVVNVDGEENQYISGTGWVAIGSSLPAGGTVGQVLTKQSVTDFDADWQTPTGGSTWFGSSKMTYATALSQGSTLHQFGISVLPVGTAVLAAPATTNVFTAQRRLAYRASASATAVAGFYHGNSNWLWRGNAANLGGFDCAIRWGAGEGMTNTSCRAFVGVSGVAGTPTDVEPSTLLNIVGMGWDSADTNIQIMHNDGSGTATKVDLGASFPVPTVDSTKVYEIEVSCAANGSSINYRVKDMGTGDETSGSITTDLPSNTTMMAPRGYVSAGGVSTQMSIAFIDVAIKEP